jgi:hypothetical protein
MPVLLVVGLLALDPEATLREFASRIAGYAELHRALEVATPPRTVTPEWSRIVDASDALAAAIVAARPNARQGDVFTPAVTKVLRERIRLVLARVDTDRYLADLYESDDFRNLRATIHARDPDMRVTTRVPASLLRVLPELPPELEYRIVGRDLALWDEHAAMIIDFIRNAFPQQSFA